MEKLDDMAVNSSDSLLSHEHLFNCLYLWKQWGDEKKVTSWLNDQIITSIGCIKVLKAFVSKSSSHDLSDHSPKITSFINLETIEDFIPIEKIQENLKEINVEALDKEDQNLINLFEKAISVRAKGHKEKI
ncbi:MAG: hypothetical protein GY710_17375 [Desulfobacteraceae bacterium]|nr:hypothetical protein [Desulfobacteraceae bacterium]